MFPRHVLCTHFWTIEQRQKFSAQALGHRLHHNLQVFRFMQSKAEQLKSDVPLAQPLRTMLGKLGSGHHPTTEEIFALDDIFTKSPFGLDSLPYNHLVIIAAIMFRFISVVLFSLQKQLCGLHGIHKGLWKRTRLARHAFVVHHMDLAIRREGGVHNMPVAALPIACHLRGLNTNGMSTDAMVEWLRQWVELSIPIDGSNISMFLHLPIMIGYNHPNNWKLLHAK